MECINCISVYIRIYIYIYTHIRRHIGEYTMYIYIYMVQGCLEAEKQLSHFGSEWTSCLNVPMTAGDVSSLVVPVISILESILLLLQIYPLVNLQKTMENHHFSWENSL